jgi:regulator of protease activity HflC (stomatin/prohibitin superfamily)
MNKKGQGLALGVIAAVVMAVIVLLVLIFDSVPAGHVGVKDTFGVIAPEALQPGIYATGLFTTVRTMSSRINKADYEASAASKDLQSVPTKLAVNYRIDPGQAPRIYKELGPEFEAPLINPAVQDTVKSITAKFTADELISRRNEVSQQILEELRSRLQPRGIIVEVVNIVNFDFGSGFNAANEAKVNAEREELAAKAELAKIQVEAEKVAAEARGRRDAAIAEAEGQARSILLKATAEAEAVRLLNEQLSRSPQYVELIKAQKWDGKLPQYVLGQAPVPFMAIPAGGN